MDLHHRGLRKYFVKKSYKNLNADSSSKITCLVALLGYIFLVSFPDNQESLSIRFLSPEERQLIVARVNQDRGDADLEKFSIKKWLGGASDWKIWAYGLCKFFSLTSNHNLIIEHPSNTLAIVSHDVRVCTIC